MAFLKTPALPVAALLLTLALAGCQTTGAGSADSRPAAGEGYAASGFRDGLNGRLWSCDDGASDCGGAPADLEAYRAGWDRGWRQRCERAKALPTLRQCEQVLGGDWTSEVIAAQTRSRRGGR